MGVMRYAQDDSILFDISGHSSTFTSCQHSWHYFLFYFLFYFRKIKKIYFLLHILQSVKVIDYELRMSEGL